ILQEDIAHIKEKILQYNIIVKHCLKEGNAVADLLSKHATTLMEKEIYHREEEMPTEIRGALRMDRLQVPSFKIRAKKHSGWFFEPP
ncbi:hypothetical protein HAX54_021842, partial [Datura stramonium]|nr:hypothetical protein [Datura stramonium]